MGPSRTTLAHSHVRTLEWVTSRERLMQLQPEWDALAEHDGTPFSRHDWLVSWDRAFGAGRPLRTPLIWRGDRLEAAMPMLASGRRLIAMANPDHSPFIVPLARNAEEMETLTKMLFDPGAAHSVSICCLPEPYGVALATAARHRRHLVRVTQGWTSPIVDTTGDFDEWRELSKPRWHSSLERCRRKMRRDHSAEIRLLDAPEHLGDAFERGLELEQAGWKGRAGSAILSDHRTADFYRSVSAAFAERGELALSSISLDGQMVAFDLCLLTNGRLYLLKTAHDESLRGLAPGLVLRLAVIERCFELGLRAHELLGKSEEYKLKFSTSERRHLALDCYARKPGPITEYMYQRALRPSLRRIFHRLRGRARASV